MIINYKAFTLRRRCLQLLAYLVMAKQVIPTASQCKIGTYVERDIHTPEENMKFLVTGAAGFIGFHIAQRLLNEGHDVVGIDNMNDYYDVSLKQARLDRLASPAFHFQQLDLADREGMAKLFATEQFDRVIHLAAQAGVRYSLENPYAYADANLMGYLNILEGCRHTKVKHLVYASSSSVYGLNRKMPFSTEDSVDHPVSCMPPPRKLMS